MLVCLFQANKFNLVHLVKYEHILQNQLNKVGLFNFYVKMVFKWLQESLYLQYKYLSHGENKLRFSQNTNHILLLHNEYLLVAVADQ